MKHRTIVSFALAAIAASASLLAQPAQNASVPKIRFESVPDFLKYSPDMNLGEVLGVAVNSKGTLAVLNHPGSATVGPLYGNASTQILEFDAGGKFVREIGKGVYGLGYGHGIRYDKYDNLWMVDKGTHAVTRFNPAGYVTLNLGRRPEGPDEPEYFRAAAAAARRRCTIDGYFRGPTDVAWDSDDNIYISDGYTNSRVAKFDKHGNWVKSWGIARARAGSVQYAAQHRDRPPEQRLRRRSRQPPDSGVRSGRNVPARHPAECAVRQDAASGARQSAGASVRRDRSRGRSASHRRRRSICTRPTSSRAASTS